MNHMSIYPGQQTWHERPHITAGPGPRDFPHILSLMPFQDDPCAELDGMSGQPQVGVQDGARPPLEDHHSGTLTIEIPQRIGNGRTPIPVDAVVDGHVGGVDSIHHRSADMPATWVK